jgi:hypothetical protein
MYLVRIFRDSSHLLASDHGRLPIMGRPRECCKKIKKSAPRGIAEKIGRNRIFRLLKQNDAPTCGAPSFHVFAWFHKTRLCDWEVINASRFHGLVS